MTTAWFLEQANHWFDLMSSRHPVLALSTKNPENHRKALSFLEDFREMILNARIGDGTFKPVQTGILLSTTSILELQQLLLHEQNFEFVLTSRFTQDNLENFFSTARLRNSMPTPFEFKMGLKMITLSQYFRPVNNTSYENYSEAFFLADLQDLNAKSAAILSETETAEVEVTEMMLSEQHSFEYYAGYVASRVVKNNALCNNCIRAVRSDSATDLDPLTNMKKYHHRSSSIDSFYM